MTAVEMPDETEEAHAPEQDRERFGSLGSVLHLLVLAWGAFIALLPFNDNSFFTHLATGRLILDRGSVPSSDPYTFTAGGEPWTVQSWLASVAYAGAEQFAGAAGLRLLVLLVFVVATSLVWRLTSATTSLIPRLLLAALAMVVCSEIWSERPYMVGFIGVGLVWCAMEGRFNPWLLAPLMWVWANTHGSFPFALILWGAIVTGAILDARFAPAGQEHDGEPLTAPIRRHLPVLTAMIVGLAASVISPLGLRALTFPIEGLARSDTLRLIVEWQAPQFTSIGERAFLLLTCLTVAAVVARPRWRSAIPAIVFVAAALVARRNLVMALPVLLPIVAGSLPRLGTLRSGTQPRLGVAFASLSAVAAVLVAAASFAGPAFALGGYPVRGLVYAEGLPTVRTATQDFSGNLLELLDGPTGTVFIDDRADMFPPEVVEDYRVLNTADPGWDAVFERWDVDRVIWSRPHPLGSVLASDPTWRVELSTAGWIVATRR